MSKTQHIFDNALLRKERFTRLTKVGVLVFGFLLLGLVSFGQVNIVNGEQFNTNAVPLVPGAWTAGSWSLYYSYAGNCHNAASESRTASIAGGTYNTYFWIPVSFQNGYTYSVSLWKKNITGAKIVFDDATDLASVISTETKGNNTAPNWEQITFATWSATYSGSGYIGICAATGNGSRMYIDDITVTETPPVCTPPTLQASLNAYTSVTETSITANWTRGNGNNCLVVAKASGSVLTQPSNGGSYSANSVFGSGSQLGTGNYVVYNGTGTTVTVSNLDPGTTYNFYVYEYNNTGPCYLIPGVTSSQATIATTNYYVNDNSLTGDIFTSAVGNNSNSGKIPSKPKLTLSNLLSSGYTFNSGDSIFIDSGTYNNEVSLSFSSSGITFIGAGSSLTIIDNLLEGASTNYFMYLTGSNVTIKNMTIKGYENNGTQVPGHSGQALTIGGGATGVLIENVVTTNNGASGGNPSISVLANCSVTINGGGGLCNTWHTAYTGGVEAFGNGITLNINNYVLGYNFKTGAYDGGGLLISNANATTTVNVTNTRFYNNEASDGGAISQRGGVLNVTDCIIEGNLAGQISTPIYGGGLRMTGGTATFTRTRFTNNALGSAGGSLRGGAIGLYSLDDNINLTLNNCYFSGNTGAEGDDIYADKYMSKTITVDVTNTTFSSASDAIYNQDADHIHLIDCGNPTVAGTNSPAVIKDNTNAPSSIPNPNLPGISSGDCSSSIILPVELTNFTGTCLKNKIELYWQTASEKNNDYFRIEKSLDGKTFTEIGIVNGSGNSNTLKSYSFSDSDIKNTNNYYRLIQVDEDGKYSVSDVIFVTNSCSDINFEINSLFYSISAQEINIDVLAGNSGNVTVSVSDILGRVVLNNEKELSEGMNHITLQANLLNGAMYIVSVYNEKTAEHKKIYINKN